MTFDEVFADHRLTYRERELLVWHLATMRQRKTIEALLPNTLGALRGDVEQKHIAQAERSSTVGTKP